MFGSSTCFGLFSGFQSKPVLAFLISLTSVNGYCAPLLANALYADAMRAGLTAEMPRVSRASARSPCAFAFVIPRLLTVCSTSLYVTWLARRTNAVFTDSAVAVLMVIMPCEPSSFDTVGSYLLALYSVGLFLSGHGESPLI